MAFKFIIAFSLFFVLSFVSLTKEKKTEKNNGGNETITQFYKAKKILQKEIYNKQELRRTFYCDCSYNDKKEIDGKSCGLKVRKNAKRSKRLEWEHIVPAHAFGQSFKEWREGDPLCVREKKKGKKKIIKKYKGRKCARKVSSLFRLMEADLYNLVPAVGEVNADRENFSFTEFDEKKRLEYQKKKVYGNCQVIIKDRKIEPRDEVKGMVARTYLYMNGAYPGHGIISRKNQKLYESWDQKFPVTKNECERYKKILAIQKNDNLILKKRCGELLGEKT